MFLFDSPFPNTSGLGVIYFEIDALIKLDTAKGIGPDKVSPLVLQKCAATLAEPLI